MAPVEADAHDKTSAARWALRIVFGTLLTAATVAGLFWLAGDFAWVEGWVYVGLVTVCQSLVALYLWRRSPELLRRRGEVGEGTKAWDKACLSLFGLAYLSELAVAAADARWGWSPLPWWCVAAGAGLFVAGTAVVTWAMAVNPHFEKTVRIQTDRGHRVIDRGPYRVVRHPGYLGTILGFCLAAPLVLRSGWAFAPAGAAVLVLVLRTALENRTLRRELAGYADYARRTRSRLLPGVW